MKPFLLLATCAIAAACASAPEAPMTPTAATVAAAPMTLDPAGTFALSANVQGMAVDGQMRIVGSPGDWEGTLYTDITGELPLSSITVQGQELRVRATTPDGPLSARMIFSGDTFTGDWSLGAEGGSLRGRRVDP